MAEKIVFAHAPEVRAKAKAALDKHGSFRKAGKAVGLPHSTLHYWASNGGFHDLAALDPETDEPVSSGGEVVDQLATTDNEPLSVPTGFPETPDDGTQSIHTPLVAAPEYPDGNEVMSILPNATQGWGPDSPKALQALLRYSNSLIAGADPARAMRAAQFIDPDFGLTEEQHTRLLNSISTLMMGEQSLLMAAVAPPGYVRNVYEQYALGDGAVSSLSETLSQLYQESYAAALNDQLTKLGRDTIDAITDPKVLSQLSDKADVTAQGIIDSWNKDLANQVGQSWLDLSSTRGTQMSQHHLDEAVSEWQDGRMDWKSEQWASDASMGSYHDGVSDWQTFNNTAELARIVPGDAEEPVCQDLVDEYGDWSDANEVLDQGDFPIHSGCIHSVELQQGDVSDDQELWTGQAE